MKLSGIPRGAPRPGFMAHKRHRGRTFTGVPLLLVALASIAALCRIPTSMAQEAVAQGEPADELVQLVVGLLEDKDKDLRALGLEQVRTAAKGPAATRRFAALLPNLPPDTQV